MKTAYKEASYADLLIVDEVHTALSPEYSKLFSIVTYKQVLGLTATVPERDDYREVLKATAPVCFVRKLIDVSGSDVVSDYKIANLEVGFNRKDSGKYMLFDGQFKRAQMELGILKYKDENLHGLSVFDIAKTYSKLKTKEPIVKYSKQYWSSMSLRKWVCYEAESKIPVVIDILTKVKKKKWIIFNKSIKFAEKLLYTLIALGFEAGMYHSKMKDDAREATLAQLASGEIDILIAVDALNAGLNVPDVDAAICVSGVSTELTNTQQVGQ